VEIETRKIFWTRKEIDTILHHGTDCFLKLRHDICLPDEYGIAVSFVEGPN
jgi:hypothetical protein